MKKYSKPEIELVKFESEDILTESNGWNIVGPGDGDSIGDGTLVSLWD